MKTCIFNAIVMLSLFSLVSCKGPSIIERFDVNPKTINVNAEGGEYEITSDPFDCVYILINDISYETERFTGQKESKTYRVSAGWISASFTSVNGEQPTTVKIEVSENNAVATREATIVVSNVIKGSGQVQIKQRYYSQGSIASYNQ